MRKSLVANGSATTQFPIRLKVHQRDHSCQVQIKYLELTEQELCQQSKARGRRAGRAEGKCLPTEVEINGVYLDARVTARSFSDANNGGLRRSVREFHNDCHRARAFILDMGLDVRQYVQDMVSHDKT